MDIAEIQKRAHATASEKGWWASERSLLECIALMHSELSEAVEAWRDVEPQQGTVVPALRAVAPPPRHGRTCRIEACHPKPEGVAAEFADTIIRIADACEHYGIPLAEAIEAKLAYNETRPYRHGGKRA